MMGVRIEREEIIKTFELQKWRISEKQRKTGTVLTVPVLARRKGFEPLAFWSVGR